MYKRTRFRAAERADSPPPERNSARPRSAPVVAQRSLWIWPPEKGGVSQSPTASLGQRFDVEMATGHSVSCRSPQLQKAIEAAAEHP